MLFHKCSQCKESKPKTKDYFGFTRTGVSWCKACNARKAKEHYHKIKNTPAYRLKKKEKYIRERNKGVLLARQRIWKKTAKGIYKSNIKLYKSQRRYNRNLCNISEDEFVRWYEAEPKMCRYCKVTALEAEFLINKMPFKARRLTIERLNNKLPYELGNLGLACMRCNDVKGDFFNDKEMKEIGEGFIKPKHQLLLKAGYL